jgi:hypothetical protein
MSERLDIPDEYSQFLLIRHIYLCELLRQVLNHPKAESEMYYGITIPEVNVSEAAIKDFPSIKQFLPQNFSYLVADDYILNRSTDGKKTMHISFTKKGYIAAVDGEFKIKHDYRQLQLRTLEETIKSTETHERQLETNRYQRKINWWLIGAAIASAVVPAILFAIDKGCYSKSSELRLPPSVHVVIDEPHLETQTKDTQPKKGQLYPIQHKADSGKTTQ